MPDDDKSTTAKPVTDAAEGGETKVPKRLARLLALQNEKDAARDARFDGIESAIKDLLAKVGAGDPEAEKKVKKIDEAAGKEKGLLDSIADEIESILGL